SHYLAAHQSAAEGPEADALAAQARVALRAAADRASALGAPEQTLAFLEQAQSVTHDSAELAELLEAAAAAATLRQRFTEAEAFLRDALARREALGDPRAIARIEAARRLLERSGNDALVTRAINNLSSVLADDDPRAGLQAARDGLEVMARRGERGFTLVDNAAAGALRSGEWDWALAQLEA